MSPSCNIPYTNLQNHIIKKLVHAPGYDPGSFGYQPSALPIELCMDMKLVGVVRIERTFF